MKPTQGYVFVEELTRGGELKKFVTVDSREANYEVVAVADDITRCKVGDIILFKDIRQYHHDGKVINAVAEDDIIGVKTNSELKK